MKNYRIWKCDDTIESEYIIVEVWNKCDIASIQKMFIEKGYIVMETQFNVFGSHFIKLKSLNLEGIDNE